jgi:hypothetical protein
MADCVISAVPDTEDGLSLAPACMVHVSWAPCLHDGEPATPVPLHAFLDEHGTRAEATRIWEIRTGRQRPLVLHRAGALACLEDHWADDRTGCPCVPEVLPAEGTDG